MTPRAEAMVWKCPEHGLIPAHQVMNEGREHYPHYHLFPDCGALCEPIEVVPAAELDRALDALEGLERNANLADVETREARAILRAAGRLDG